MNRSLRIAYALIYFALILPAARADEITIHRIEGKFVDGFYYIDATSTVTLSADAREAIESGVPLTFAFDCLLEQERRYLWDKNVLALRRLFQIARHALADSYIVTDTVADKHIVAQSLDDALRALGSVSNFAIGKTEVVQSETPLTGRCRVLLDIESLPAPLRPIAYVSPSWRLKSPWHTWKIGE